jgi:hypothetical protein
MNTFLVFAKPADNAANAGCGQARPAPRIPFIPADVATQGKVPGVCRVQVAAALGGDLWCVKGWLDAWELPMKRVWIAALALVPMLGAAPAHAQVSSEELRKCTFVEDMTRERLDCFDKLIRPEAIQVLQQAAPKTVYDCRYIKEQDARLKCFNRFATQPAAPAQRAAPKAR